MLAGGSVVWRSQRGDVQAATALCNVMDTDRPRAPNMTSLPATFVAWSWFTFRERLLSNNHARSNHARSNRNNVVVTESLKATFPRNCALAGRRVSVPALCKRFEVQADTRNVDSLSPSRPGWNRSTFVGHDSHGISETDILWAIKGRIRQASSD